MPRRHPLIFCEQPLSNVRQAFALTPFVRRCVADRTWGPSHRCRDVVVSEACRKGCV